MYTFSFGATVRAVISASGCDDGAALRFRGGAGGMCADAVGGYGRTGSRQRHPDDVASFAWWRGFCSAPWRSCCRDHAGLAAGRCRGLNREGCARSGPFGSLPLRQSPKAPPLTRITMPRPMRTMGKRMCSQRSSTSAIGGRVATNFARATRTATSARKTMQ